MSSSGYSSASSAGIGGVGGEANGQERDPNGYDMAPEGIFSDGIARLEPFEMGASRLRLGLARALSALAMER